MEFWWNLMKFVMTSLQELVDKLPLEMIRCRFLMWLLHQQDLLNQKQ
jgi:hypothetical protein